MGDVSGARHLPNGRRAVAAPLKPGETRIAGRTYLFTPDMYQGGIVETGRIGDMLLELAWPEMRGLTAEERAMWPPRPTLLILANSAAQTAGDAAPVDYLINAVRNELGIAISLYSSKERVPRPADDAPQGAVLGSGMVKIAKSADPAGDVGSDVYALPPIKDTNEFIRCNRADKIFTQSSCSQYFVAERSYS